MWLGGESIPCWPVASAMCSLPNWASRDQGNCQTRENVKIGKNETLMIWLVCDNQMKTICLWHLTLDPRVMADRNPYNKINPITSTRQYIKRIKENIYVYIWNIAFFSGLCGYESSRRWRRIPNSANAFINGLLIISSQNCLGSIHTRNIIIFFTVLS